MSSASIHRMMFRCCPMVLAAFPDLLLCSALLSLSQAVCWVQKCRLICRSWCVVATGRLNVWQSVTTMTWSVAYVALPLNWKLPSATQILSCSSISSLIYRSYFLWWWTIFDYFTTLLNPCLTFWGTFRGSENKGDIQFSNILSKFVG